ncbi:chromatin remodelling complex Rsc7/Swp82 subunit-domain-containing protein [Bisporella sp. PMI_857]|nr:chromatin remodelling complex Rsc7/Swp82 subunit-domain-containing protein [Bisporella sp. PMI_857]
MYSVHQANGIGGTGTVNPAELNSQGKITPTIANLHKFAPILFRALANPATDTRGIKRSRSPDNNYGDLQGGDNIGDDGDSKPRKRGRPMKTMRAPGVPESPNQPSMSLSGQSGPPQTPQSQNVPLPSQLTNITPTQSSPPPKTTPKSVIKALPTVRDHTTDQLGPEGDEYIPREYDDQGEKKVTATGHLTDAREYRCRTFFVPNRGDKLFMLATECARVLGYRDSYLLFNKNRSLYKIIATQAEKEDLIHQEILPFSYRSRQIAIVTAKSMFRQFGSRVIVNGRRVRDDYWEGKARKQGFTEEDLAGEKRPGAAKARDAAAAEANANASLALAHGDVVYSNSPAHYGIHQQPQTVQPAMIGAPGGAQMLPMITLAPEQESVRLRDYSNIQRPRQEISGPAYQDRTQASPATELLQQAHSAADYNKSINVRRDHNNDYLQRHWRQPHEAPAPVTQQPIGTSDGLSSAQTLQSPRTSQSGIQQPAISQQTPQHMMAPQSYSQPPRQQNPIAQSPMRSSQGGMRSDQIGSSGMSFGTGQLSQGGSTYGFAPQTQMYPPSQTQQSPQHTYPSYTAHSQSPHVPQSPHNPPPQLRHSGSNPQMQQPALQYPGMQGLGQGYPAPGRGLYPEQNTQQFMQQATTAGPQPGAQGWAPQQTPQAGGSWGWSGQQQ